MSNPPDTVPLAEYEAVRQLHQTALRQLHRWQTGTEIESDNIPHWVTRSEFEELEEKLKRAEYQRDQFALKLRRDAHEVKGDYADGENILEVFAEIREGLEAEGVNLNGSQLLDDLEESRHGDWVKLSEFEAVAKRRDELERMVKGLVELRDSLRKELSEKESQLTEAHAAHDVAHLEQFRNYDALKEECDLLRKDLFMARSDRDRLRDYRDQLIKQLGVATRDRDQLRKSFDELTEHNDRLRKHLKEAGAKGANYKREIRRLQDALLRQRGQHRWVEIERLEQRVKALEGKGEDSAVAQEIAAADAIVAKYRHEIRQQKMDTIAKYLRAVADSGVAPDDAERLLDVLEDIDNGDDNA